MGAVARTIDVTPLSGRGRRGGRAFLAAPSTVMIALLAAAAAGLELRGVGAALYLAQCPHGMPGSAAQWGAAWLGHWRALPVGTAAMTLQCLLHSRLHRHENAILAGARVVAMLLAMPLACEVVARYSSLSGLWATTVGYVMAMQLAMLLSDAAIDGICRGARRLVRLT